MGAQLKELVRQMEHGGSEGIAGVAWKKQPQQRKAIVILGRAFGIQARRQNRKFFYSH